MHTEAVELVKHQGRHFSLRVPSLAIEQGQAVGLVGNNGAGKTTFLRLLLDLIQADEGHVEIGGVPVVGRSDWKTDVGAYLDEAFLLDFLTAEEFFQFVGGVYGRSQTGIERALVPYRAFFGDGVLGATPAYLRDLSMGNKKKVGIVAAMMVEPRLLILDEPFANLDPGSQLRLKAMLRELNEQHGTTMLISSHDLGHVTEICERITILDDGALVRDLQTSDATLRELEAYFATW